MSADDESGIWVLPSDEFIILVFRPTLGMGDIFSIHHIFLMILLSDIKIINIVMIDFFAFIFLKYQKHLWSKLCYKLIKIAGFNESIQQLWIKICEERCCLLPYGVAIWHLPAGANKAVLTSQTLT